MTSPAASAPPEAAPAPVRHRHVFYVSGFDPKGPAHYHRLYADEGAKAAAVGGYALEVGPRRRAGEHGAAWSVRWRGPLQPPAAAAAEVHTEVEFLRWDDLVRAHWPRHAGVLARDLLATTALYLRTGALWRMARLAWPPVVALVVPVLVLLALLAALPLAALASWALVRAGAPLAAGVAAVPALAAAAVLGARAIERRMNMQWLLRSYAYTGRQGTHGWPALEARLDAFAQRIVARAEDPAPCDELLVVAHSSGSIMASIALARALQRAPGLARRGPRLALLTLGQWSPLLSSLPGAGRFRAELATLAAEDALDWVDFTAPADGCCFALTDPVTAAGLPRPRPAHPRLLNPRFASQFSPATYAALVRDRFRLHFQYLMAAERAGDYDYFALTAGPWRLGERCAGRPSIDGYPRFQVLDRWARRLLGPAKPPGPPASP
ncbi:hypothetical protein [Piscinibacter sakaiensis]|uniref:Putative integral membrane protein Cj1412c n=1 Tax=Piscinibacter sakaiensis TaxID=1547922 RepID=A0A0K8P857_PISS1|nr:hypothetical protein [Piscinibacter sakaiensis]GAP38679.1 putative integral membrane protein Cj1412c [Piscinibacter sakaiensis]